MKTALAITVASFYALFCAQAQVVLRAGEAQTYSYQLGPGGGPCVPATQKPPSSASIILKLDGYSMQQGGAFRMEIFDRLGHVAASALWTGSNSPLFLSVSGIDFYPNSARLTGLTGSVVITSIALPWTLADMSVLTRQWESCPMDGVPFVPSLHLAVSQPSSSQVRVSWTTNASDYRLESADSLRAPGWTEITNMRSIEAGYFEVTLESLGSPRFLRLRKP